MKKNKEPKPTLLKNTIFSIVVAVAIAVVVLNVFFIIGLVFVIVSSDFEVYSRTVFIFIGLISVVNIIVLVLLVFLNRRYEGRITEKIIIPLQKIERHISNLVHGDYDEPVVHVADDEIGDLFKAVDNVRIQLSDYKRHEQEVAVQKQIHISGLMHDIATPVTRINGCASMIEDGMVTDSDDVKRFASMILHSTEDINLMLKSLAAVEKYNETEIHINMQPIDLAMLLDRYVSDLALEMSSKDVTLTFENCCSKKTVCMIDVKSCKRALMNLINNSVKYKKAETDCMIIIKLEDGTDDSILFSLSDNGIGVEPGSENMIFEMFYRGDSARRNINDGNGLGLYLTKQILNANQVKVWAKNNGNGLTVYAQFRRSEAKPVRWYK